MTKAEFKRRWESDDNGGGITFEDIAACAVAWGIIATPKTQDMYSVRYRVLVAAGTNDAAEWAHDTAAEWAHDTAAIKEAACCGCSWCRARPPDLRRGAPGDVPQSPGMAGEVLSCDEALTWHT
jgi:hypothetical protein